ncbi:MAG: thioredoxin fold domain-containing protein [candidate division Zixibacteria bacterium]|nr:thioredoxin fold domain-containing protein [candidate division Zixibacteria bacterium]
MRQITLVVVLITAVALTIGCSQKEAAVALTEAPYYSSLQEAQKAVGSTGKPILVEFYTDWCKWCATIDTVVLTDSAAIEFFSSEMILVKINAGKDTVVTAKNDTIYAKDLAEKYHISGYPTIVMLDTDGVEIDRLVGYLPPAEFIKTFRNYGKGIGTLADLLGKVETKPDRSLYYRIAEKYKYRGGSEEAVKWFQRIIDEGSPTDSLSGESRMALADLMRRNKDYDKAIGNYALIAKDFKGKEIGENAEVWTAITFRQKGDTAEAIKRLEDYVKAHPESKDNVTYCQKQIENLKGTKDKKAEK